MTLDTGWFKSSHSTDTGDCVEVRFTDDGVSVRNSRARGGAQLHFTNAEFFAFAAGVRDGEFERRT